jgi:hypothetical protein
MRQYADADWSLLRSRRGFQYRWTHSAEIRAVAVKNLPDVGTLAKLSAQEVRDLESQREAALEVKVLQMDNTTHVFVILMLYY